MVADRDAAIVAREGFDEGGRRHTAYRDLVPDHRAGRPAAVEVAISMEARQHQPPSTCVVPAAAAGCCCQVHATSLHRALHLA
eukprot:COSAG01_NODE_4406_length_5056_cov_124.577365_13_plen_83_part_00